MKLLRLRTKSQPDKMTYLRTSDIRLHKEFQSLFPINPTVRDAIASSIRKNGFDENHPLVIWREQGCLIDGHSRLAATKLVGLRKVPVIYMSFPDLDAALDYARRLQFDRRNITDPDLFAYVLRLDVDNLPGTGRKQERLARLCNISVTKAVRIIKVKKDGTRKQHNAILNGSTTIHSTYELMKPSRVRTNSRSARSSAADGPTVAISESALITMIGQLSELQDKSCDIKDITSRFARQLPKSSTKSKVLSILEDPN
jgi:hypothetical protein